MVGLKSIFLLHLSHLFFVLFSPLSALFLTKCIYLFFLGFHFISCGLSAIIPLFILVAALGLELIAGVVNTAVLRLYLPLSSSPSLCAIVVLRFTCSKPHSTLLLCLIIQHSCKEKIMFKTFHIYCVVTIPDVLSYFVLIQVSSGTLGLLPQGTSFKITCSVSPLVMNSFSFSMS